MIHFKKLYYVFCMLVSFIPLVSADPLLKNPYPLNTNFPVTMIDGKYYQGQNCTYWAWERAREVCGTSATGFADHWSNAYTWPDYAINEKMTVSDKPLLNSVAVILKGRFVGDVGHVAWVEKIDGDNVTVSEMDYFGFLKKNLNTYPASTFNGGYIKIDNCSSSVLPTSDTITISGDLVVGKNISIASWLTNTDSTPMLLEMVVVSIHNKDERVNPIKESKQEQVLINSNDTKLIAWTTTIESPGAYDVVIKIKQGDRYPEIVAKSITVTDNDDITATPDLTAIDMCVTKFSKYFGQKIGSPYTCYSQLICQKTSGPAITQIAVYKDLLRSDFFFYRDKDFWKFGDLDNCL